MLIFPAEFYYSIEFPLIRFVVALGLSEERRVEEEQSIFPIRLLLGNSTPFSIYACIRVEIYSFYVVLPK